ncbi:MAG: hypothetical protein KTR24_06180 [Saprospiraceae bacterium]|nr:hypothetical protein [Saprospiraceae bacterium]
MNEEKFGKYLLYACGEIILIVIGIGIAYQLSEAQHRSEEKRLEKRLIQEIRGSLELELNDFIANRDLHHSFLESQDMCIGFLEHDSTLLNTVSNFSIAHQSSTFITSSAPFESLKAFGLDRILSEKIRRYIIYLYDIAYPDFARRHARYHALVREALDLGLIYFDDWSPQSDTHLMRPRDLVGLTNDRKYLMKLKQLRSMNELLLLSIEDIKVVVATTIDLIDEYYAASTSRGFWTWSFSEEL